MDPADHDAFMREAAQMANENVLAGRGGPFGCVVVRRGKVVARGANQVTSTNDPTAHGEVNAIRAACRALGTFTLEECVIYSSCEPCPMCLAAIYWARLDGLYFGGSQQDAAKAGFDDAFLYEELKRPIGERKTGFPDVACGILSLFPQCSGGLARNGSGM